MKTLSETLVNGLIGVSGLLAGIVSMLVISYIARRIGDKKRLYDERQQHVSTKSRAAAWNITLFLIMIAWGIVILVDGISFTFFLFTGLHVANCIGLIITSIYYANRN
jgi:hypothetical protein